jgi:kynurenine 3-monooxygenase
MVPFYGQGLNCGLEDVRVLDVLLRRAGVPRALDNPVELRRAVTATLSTYSEQRHEDLVAICDLAMQN